MRIACAVGRHEVAPGEVRNQGFAFSRCRCCGRDMVRSSREWRTVPRGFRVVWKRPAARQTEISAAQLLLDLPAAGRALALRAAPDPRRGHVSAILDLLAAALRYLAWAGAARLRAWRSALLGPRMVRQPVFRLPAY